MKKIICICFFVLGLVLLQNCDPCGPFEQLDHFDIIGLSNQVLVDASPPINTSVYKSNTRIKAEDLHSFQLDWKVNYIAQNIINNSSSLMACSPPIPGTEGALVESYKAIRIINLFDLHHMNAIIPKHSLVSDLFQINNKSSSISIQEFLRQDTSTIQAEQLHLVFKDILQVLMDSAQFEIQIDLSNEEKYVRKTDTILFR